MLTGEPDPVTKHPEPVEHEAPLAESTSMAFSGSMVVFGQV